MPFQEPVVVFTGESDIDPFRVRSHLLQNGIEAEVIEFADPTSGDVFAGALVEPPAPQLVVEKSEFEAARALVVAFEQQTRIDREQRNERLASAEPVSVECEHCKKTTAFAATLTGTVQVCPRCQSYLDVGDDDAFDDWQVDEADPEA